MSDIPTMNFADALLLLREGRPIRREKWSLESKQRLVNPKGDRIFTQFHNNEHFYDFTLTSEDVLADDWLEYVE